MAVRETLLAQLARMRAHGRRATTITPSATKQFQCLRNNMTPHPIVHLSSNEEVVGFNPIVHPSSYGEGLRLSLKPNLIVYLSSNEVGLSHDPIVDPSWNEEGHVIVPTDTQGFRFSLGGFHVFLFKTIQRFPHAAFDIRPKWPATSNHCLLLPNNSEISTCRI